MACEGWYGTPGHRQELDPTDPTTAAPSLPLSRNGTRSAHSMNIAGIISRGTGTNEGEQVPLRSSQRPNRRNDEGAGHGDQCKGADSRPLPEQRIARPAWWNAASAMDLLDAKMCCMLTALVIVTVMVYSTVCVLGYTPSNETNLRQKPVVNEYDFIVVGAGPAGSTLARRLSDDVENRVLLLEAGLPSQYELGGEDFLSDPLTPFDIPLMWPSVAHMQGFRWEVRDHTKTEHPNALVAKALGGCGIHNAMLYVRGLESDFVKWDVEGFDYVSAVKIWMRGENYTGEGPLPKWHGRDGPITTSPPYFYDEVAPFFLQSCEGAGIKITEDFNKPGGREGAGYYHFAIKSGVRDSAARALLGDIIMGNDVRKNLKILTSAYVSRVAMKGDRQWSVTKHGKVKPSQMKPDAAGVDFMHDGHLVRASLAPGAASAVIVTTGALRTPKLLMESGIGDRDELAEYKLDCISHLPGVGKNLQDHTSIGVMYMLGPDLLKLMPSAYVVAQELERYTMSVLKALDLSFPAGMAAGDLDSDALSEGEESAPSLFSSAGLSGGAFLRSPYPSPHQDAMGNMSAPDIQLTLFPRVTEPHILALANIRPSAQAPPMMLVAVSLLDPEGRHVVRLDPQDPHLGNPYIDRDEREGAPAPLTELDAKRLAWGVRQVRRIMGTQPLEDLHRGEVYPGPGISGPPDDAPGEPDDLMEWVESHVYSNSHWSGTARMGKESSPDTVVDERMAVKGVKRLFVGDASVIPYIPNGNVHSTVLLVAEKLAEYLLAGVAGARAAVAEKNAKRGAS